MPFLSGLRSVEACSRQRSGISYIVGRRDSEPQAEMSGAHHSLERGQEPSLAPNPGRNLPLELASGTHDRTSVPTPTLPLPLLLPLTLTLTLTRNPTRALPRIPIWILTLLLTRTLLLFLPLTLALALPRIPIWASAPGQFQCPADPGSLLPRLLKRFPDDAESDRSDIRVHPRPRAEARPRSKLISPRDDRNAPQPDGNSNTIPRNSVQG